MSTSATMDSVYTCGMYAMAVMTVETTQMNGIAVCSHREVKLERESAASGAAGVFYRTPNGFEGK